MITFGSLFAGIGGIDLGFERAGMTCKWQVEIDPFCQKVLQKHWPDVKRYADVREVGKHNLEAVDLICGGFPCQDVSLAGKQLGLDGNRSPLWSEYARIICELNPRWIVAENVPGLLSANDGRFFANVLRDLAQAGYDAEWTVLSACQFGAPHSRERVFLVAYPGGERCVCGNSGINSETKVFGKDQAQRSKNWGESKVGQKNNGRIRIKRPAWTPEPTIERVVNGLPNQLDRIRSLGNAVVPQVAEWIGRRIVEANQ